MRIKTITSLREYPVNQGRRILHYGWVFSPKFPRTTESIILEKQNELASLIAYQASKQPKTQ
jgi:hypothetical protein